MSEVITDGLGFRYPAHEELVLDGISLRFTPGEVAWLTGAPGAGTSTLLLALAGLAPRLTGGERSGAIRAFGSDPADIAMLPHGIAYLGPTPALQLSGIAKSVWDEVAVGPMNLHWPITKLREAVDGALVQLGIRHLAQRDPTQLSGGEQQRVLLAALAATSPRLWLLDEPFSALDHEGSLAVRAWLRELVAAGSTVVIACDDADVMATTADRLIILEQGHVVADGAPTELLAGDVIAEVGATTTDAATLAHLAGVPAPRPLTTEALLACYPVIPGDGGSDSGTPPVQRNGAAVLTCREVGFAYGGGPGVLHGLSLEVHAGQGVALFGANGAGKSTLLRLAMALDHPTYGSVHVLGRSTVGLHPEDLAPEVGFLFQQPERQLFATSVRAECALGPRLAGWAPARIAEAVEAVLEELDLSGVADAHPYDLPLPKRRLVALAGILVTDPELLLLDEPTAALDGRSRDRVVQVVRSRVARGGAVVAITHDHIFAHEALELGVLLQDGTVTRIAPMRSLLTSADAPIPASLAMAQHLGLLPGADRRELVARVLADCASR